MNHEFNGFINCRYKKSTLDKKIIDGKNSYELVSIPCWNERWGILLPEGIIVVDADNMKEAEILAEIIKDKKIKCYISKTKRGKHFYFREPKEFKIKNWVDKSVPIGLVDIDYRNGNVMSLAFEHSEGKWNEWEIGPAYDEKIDGFRLDPFDLDEVPYWLFPFKSPGLSLVGLEEGDGRNDELFRLKWRLVNLGFNKMQVEEIFKIINIYVFASALSERELITLAEFTPEMEIDQHNRWFDANHNFLHNEMAAYLSHILYVYRDSLNNIYFYNGEYYSLDPFVLESRIAEECPSLRESNRLEVVKYMRLMKLNSTIEPLEYHDYICVENGLVNVLTGKKIGFSPSYFVKNQLPITYDALAYDIHVDNFLNDVLVVKGDKEQRLIFEEYLGYTLLCNDNKMKKMLFMIGPSANNGKSTTISMVQSLITSDNYSALKLFEISNKNDKLLVELVNKLANFDDDADSSMIKADNMSYLKTLISDENKITINPKFQKPYKDFVRAKFWVASNHILKTEQRGNEWMTRLVILAFSNIFEGDKADRGIKNKLKTPEAKSYLLNLALAGYQRLLKNNRFTESATSNKWTEIYRLENNSVLRFLQQSDYKKEELEGLTVKSLYVKYINYMENDDNHSPQNINKFEKGVLEWYKNQLEVVINEHTRTFKSNNI